MTEEIEHAMKLARDCSHKMATPANWHALQSALEAIDAKARHAAAALALEQQAELEALRAALADMLAGWRYIRQSHGDLYGVGWDRAQGKAEKALGIEPGGDIPAEFFGYTADAAMKG